MNVPLMSRISCSIILISPCHFLILFGLLRKMNVLFEGEIGLYLGHFMSGLRFPLDLDLVEILKFYGVLQCRYIPSSIGCMISFLSLFF